MLSSFRVRGVKIPFERMCGAAALAAALGTAPAAAAARTAVGDLRTETLRDPIGIDEARPRLSFMVTSDQRGQRQAAYQIWVATDPARLRTGAADLWDSGRRASADNAFIRYEGRALTTGVRAFWTVRVWDAAGRSYAPARPARFEMGLLEAGEWHGRFIGLGEAAKDERLNVRAAAWLVPVAAAPVGPSGAQDLPPVVAWRRQLTLPAGPVGIATLTFAAQAKGTPWERRINVRVFLNGRLVSSNGGSVGSPRVIDVTSFVRAGDNQLVIEGPHYADKPFLAELVVHRPDRSVLTVGSDASWRARFQATRPITDDWLWEAESAGWGPVRVIAKFGEIAVAKDAELYRNLNLAVAAVHLRHTFTAKSRPVAARLYVTAAGDYEVRLNGRRVGDAELAPGWTQYDQRLRYQTYDVTSMLRTGDNAIGAIVADGWFSGRTGVGHRVFGVHKAFLAEVRVRFADGREQVVATDASWRVGTGPLRSSDHFQGEIYDARSELSGWDRPGYDDRSWRRAAVLSPQVGVLAADFVPPVRAFARLRPLARTEPAPGRYVFDLGQNIAGRVRLRLRAPAGTLVRLRHGEMLNKDGTLFTDNLKNAAAMDDYVARGGADEVFEPRFTFHGFRFVEVTGLASPPALGDVTGVALSNDLPRIGHLATGDAGLDRLFENIYWSQRDNFVSVPTDCPQRSERNGWTGDIQAFAATAVLNLDSWAFLRGWLETLRDGQAENGAYPDVAPHGRAHKAGSFAWADAGALVPWDLYQSTGDRGVLTENYAAMKRWVDLVTRNAVNGLSTQDGYGDWVGPPPQTPKNELAPLFHARAAWIVAQAAERLGNGDDARHYRTVFEDVRSAWSKAFLAADGRIQSDSQTAYALALRFDMVPAALRSAVGSHLVAAVARDQFHPRTGFLGTPHLLPALSEAGRSDVAWKVLLAREMPSWLYMVDQGATTIWERWDGYTPEVGPTNRSEMNSYNHYAFGAVGDWMFTRLAGIDRPKGGAGYGRIVIQPALHPAAPRVRASLVTPQGRIAVAHEVDPSGRLRLTVEIPVASTAEVHVPLGKGNDPSKVHEAGGPIPSRFVRLTGIDAGDAVFEVASGRYVFEATLAP